MLFDVVFFVASLGLGVPAHALAHTSLQTRASCRMAQGESGTRRVDCTRCLVCMGVCVVVFVCVYFALVARSLVRD